MKHASSRELFAYWDKCRGPRPAPERDEIDPGAVRKALSDIFMLSYDPAGGHPFRLAGTRVCALFGRELKGEPFLRLWGDNARSIADLVSILKTETVGIVASASGRTADGLQAELELMLLPLSHHGRPAARLIGMLAPMSVPYWLGIAPLTRLSVGSYRHIGPNTDLIPAPAIVPGSSPATPARVEGALRGFTVYEGGRREGTPDHR
jgi:hypothetical protein